MQNLRYLQNDIKQWPKKRMIFIGGPRQVGKTFLAQQFISSKEAYLNWDYLEDRESIKKK